jgi:chromate transporter
LITIVIARLYSEYGQLPKVKSFVYGIKPAVISIIPAAVFLLAKKTVTSFELGIIGVLSLISSLNGMNEIEVMYVAGCPVLILFIICNSGSDLKNYFPLKFPVSKTFAGKSGQEFKIGITDFK